MKRTSRQLVAIGHAYGAMEVAIASSLLEAAGIAVVVQARQFGSIAWNHVTAVQGMALLVPASDASEAQDVLAAYRPVRRRRAWR